MRECKNTQNRVVGIKPLIRLFKHEKAAIKHKKRP